MVVVGGCVGGGVPVSTECKVGAASTAPGFLLLPGRRAVDAADAFSAWAEDQRGLARPAGRGPDMGAMESAVTPTSPRWVS